MDALRALTSPHFCCLSQLVNCVGQYHVRWDGELDSKSGSIPDNAREESYPTIAETSSWKCTAFIIQTSDFRMEASVNKMPQRRTRVV